ncbi:hypothetical protein HK099_004664 [Clydaea vesicula]|uniref:NADH dehydrogenase subunit 7 n=1 Tax=Clydaea vesicula TaxID=447962 RepID=A0AAD5Y049_9FUNG|nr:hypothetical protein HK099_004664 [Clydaea vesicula]
MENFNPQHPAAHGVARLTLELKVEFIEWQNGCMLDYCSLMFNCPLAVEKVFDIQRGKLMEFSDGESGARMHVACIKEGGVDLDLSDGGKVTSLQALDSGFTDPIVSGRSIPCDIRNRQPYDV